VVGSRGTLLSPPPLNHPRRGPFPLRESRPDLGALEEDAVLVSKRASLVVAGVLHAGASFLQSSTRLIFSVTLFIVSIDKGVGSSANRSLKSFAPS